MVTAETYHMRQCRSNVTFINVKSQFRGKNTGSSIEKFRLLFHPRILRILQRLQHIIIQFRLYYLLVVAYGRLKTKENFKHLALKVVAVAYKRWSLT